MGVEGGWVACGRDWDDSAFGNACMLVRPRVKRVE